MSHRNQEQQYVHAGGNSGFFLFNLAGRSRTLILLLALIGQILLTALGAGGRLLPSIYNAVVVLAVIIVAADSHRHLWAGLALGIPSIALSFLSDVVDHPVLRWLTYLFVLTLYLAIIRLMLIKIFNAKCVTLDTIGYALCTYVLLGVVWTVLYAPVAATDPQAFTQPLAGGTTAPSANLIYFSFVTLTTLGYGDISPVSPIARSLAILEALTGTLFLAVLISRLVGAYGRQER